MFKLKVGSQTECCVMILDQRCYDNDDNDDGSFISMTRLSPWPPRPPPHRCQAAWPWLGCGEKWRKIINVQDNHVRVSCTRAQKGQTSHLRLVAALWRAGTQSMSMPCPPCPQCPVSSGPRVQHTLASGPHTSSTPHTGDTPWTTTATRPATSCCPDRTTATPSSSGCS